MQYASNDLGSSFSFISTVSGANRGFPDIIAHNGRLVVAFVGTDGTTTAAHPPKVFSLGSAYESISTAYTGAVTGQSSTDPMEWGTEAGAAFSDGELSLWSDEDGWLYLMGRDQDAGALDELAVRASKDGGASWYALGGGPAVGMGVSAYSSNDASTVIRDLSVCAHRGRAIMVHRFAANPGTADSSACATYLGGFTSVCLPQSDDTGVVGPYDICGWTHTWFPFDEPDNVGGIWTASGAGSCTLTASGGQIAAGEGPPATTTRPPPRPSPRASW